MATIHGHAARGRQSRTYRAWKEMKSRCDNSNNSRFRDWGGRGITYPRRWKKFENFLDDMGECPLGLTLDRKNNNGNYSKVNCRWATWDTQYNNRRTNNNSLSKSETVTQVSKRLGLKSITVFSRLHRSRPPSEALLPYSFKGAKTLIEHDGEKRPLAEWARRAGMPKDRVYRRLRLGWTIEKALSFQGDGRQFNRRQPKKKRKRHGFNPRF